MSTQRLKVCRVATRMLGSSEWLQLGFNLRLCAPLVAGRAVEPKERAADSQKVIISIVSVRHWHVMV